MRTYSSFNRADSSPRIRKERTASKEFQSGSETEGRLGRLDSMRSAMMRFAMMRFALAGSPASYAKPPPKPHYSLPLLIPGHRAVIIRILPTAHRLIFPGGRHRAPNRPGFLSSSSRLVSLLLKTGPARSACYFWDRRVVLGIFGVWRIFAEYNSAVPGRPNYLFRFARASVRQWILSGPHRRGNGKSPVFFSRCGLRFFYSGFLLPIAGLLLSISGVKLTNKSLKLLASGYPALK
ncbi:MAG: hypothetical protein BECKG1743D_GA0114223_104204 [Candidatus Kentron sp. G]|nr:MAG: hypothetical protein BECKG1743F_GA0114225_104143 [Candidatus Kentron sp. G]VFN01629.1 MAG: hypothetical protein BECKG1743E_GA0114224_104293 [Candidatus Kentron sp. G]VFN03001.1 MAG: hypothetical protein BECKG1743D_GA0114223_104204 [Candidatus Kentron sp. G]